MEKALEIYRNIKADILTISLKEKDKGILSTIGSMYDPLGIVSPFLLKSKLIMQALYRLNIGWDELIPAYYQDQ